jgi:hypothetical protein
MFAFRRMLLKRSTLIFLRCGFGSVPLVPPPVEGVFLEATESAFFASASFMRDTLKSYMVRFDSGHVAPWEENRAPAQVVASDG